jgi:hypothetical protein
MILLCCDIDKSNSLTISEFTNIVIAIANVALASYVFIYQIRKDKKNELAQTEKEQLDRITVLDLQEQNIRLLWFKEIIVQPHLTNVNLFYQNLHSIEEKLSKSTISEEIKADTLEFIKSECSKIRKSFIDILRTVNPELYNDIKNNIDSLLDHITGKLFDAGLNLNDKRTFEREVGSKISYSHNDLISKLYNYKGK